MLPLTRAELELWRTLEALQREQSILDWIPRISPTYSKPEHLRKLVQLIWRMQYEKVNVWCSVPPRFSKTETILHSIVWRLMVEPTCEIVYCTYGANLAYAKSRKMREMAERAGIRLKKGSSGVHLWQTTAGGSVQATGIGGPLTGSGARWLVIDDAIKNREEAESAVIREKHWDWFTSTALTRIEPGGSVLVNATRWHSDDLIGRIQQNFPDWHGVHARAVWEDAKGKRKTLWPQRWSLKEMDEKRRLVGEYEWASLFQGEPRPKGGRMFGAATRYQNPLVVEGVPYKLIIGADPAASEKTSADYSAAVVLACTGQYGTLSFRADILDVYKGHVQVPEFAQRLADMARKWQCPVAVEAVAGFKAVPQILRGLDRTLHVIEAPVMGDKFTRALPASAAWNDGRIRVPASDALGVDTTWVADFLKEIEAFTGVSDPHDDQVDALSHAYNCAQQALPFVQAKNLPPIRSLLPFG